MQAKAIEKIIKQLNKLYPTPTKREKPFPVLIGVLLSHRTKDEVTHLATRRLLKKANTPQKMLSLPVREIEKLIYPVGFYRQKARRIKKICRILVEKYRGGVPKTKEELLNLPGIGLKSANVILSRAYNRPVIATDVHVAVITKRWGLTKENTPEKITEDLERIIPEKHKRIFNWLLVEFGKEYCRTRNPKCWICPVYHLCPYENKSSTT